MASNCQQRTRGVVHLHLYTHTLRHTQQKNAGAEHDVSLKIAMK